MKGDMRHVWQSPLAVRVGSWVMSGSEDDNRTQYISTVTYFSMPGKSWQCTQRFSGFQKLEGLLRPALNKAFPEGMTEPFPFASFSSIFGTTDVMRNARQEGMNRWIHEVLCCVEVMLDDNLRKAVFDFFEVDMKIASLQEARRRATIVGAGGGGAPKPDPKAISSGPMAAGSSMAHRRRASNV